MTLCFFCNKKLSCIEETTGLCKCGKSFCKKHKFPEDHSCTFDYKEKQKELLKNTLPSVVNNKVNSI